MSNVSSDEAFRVQEERKEWFEGVLTDATEEFDRQLKNGLVKDKDYDGFVLGYLMNSCLPDQ